MSGTGEQARLKIEAILKGKPIPRWLVVPLKEIRMDVIALEVQISELQKREQDLIDEMYRSGVREDVEVPF